MSFQPFSFATVLLLCVVHLAVIQMTSGFTVPENHHDISRRPSRVRRQFPCFGACKVPPSSEPLVKQMPNPVYGMVQNGLDQKGIPDGLDYNNELGSHEIAYHGKFERLEMVNDFETDEEK
ncbi:unnamed protein product [Orchesella dallaii]|uniref:Uncharacterized protein n=1 Tax=Orchesella dallaii TaxID=48710 RepID=A0ABP1PRU4_9HEXA